MKSYITFDFFWGGGGAVKRLTPVKAIRAKCLDCCCNQIVEVRECQIEKCPLRPYRMGKRPKENKCLVNV